jgi:hypothetical protein
LYGSVGGAALSGCVGIAQPASTLPNAIVMIDTMAANDGLERGNAAWTRLRAETRAGCEREGCIDMEFPQAGKTVRVSHSS